jgi:hypothetical protein
MERVRKEIRFRPGEEGKGRGERPEKIISIFFGLER